MTIDRAEVLRRSALFEMLSPAEVEVLAEFAKPAHFRPGEVVFEAGTVGACLFVLAAGEVEVVHGQGASQKLLSVLAAPESFGEMALIDREVRSATVRARTECDALQLSAENFTAFRKRSRDGFTFVVINIARVLSTRLRESNAKLAAYL